MAWAERPIESSLCSAVPEHHMDCERASSSSSEAKNTTEGGGGLSSQVVLQSQRQSPSATQSHGVGSSATTMTREEALAKAHVAVSELGNLNVGQFYPAQSMPGRKKKRSWTLSSGRSLPS